MCSVTVGEGAIVRDCRRIGRMWVTCKVGIIDYSVSGEYGGGRGSGQKGRVRRGRKGGVRKRGTKNMKEKRIKIQKEGSKKVRGTGRVKQIDIWVEWKREIGNSKLKKNENKNNNKKKPVQ
jgi:hypothetical protein